MPMVLLNGQVKGKAAGLIDLYVFNLCKELGIGRMHRKLIEIDFVTDQEGQLGNAWGDEKEGYAHINIARKCEGAKVEYAEMMQTLAHEMVHVKQWATGEMKELVRQNKTRFKGELFGNTEYWFRPWEIEAHGIEKGLFVKWAEATGVSNQSWTHENLY